MASSRLPHAEANNCSLAFQDPSGDTVFLDFQSAQPGTFTAPGVIELETYEPDYIAEISWIYFKGDYFHDGPQPGHPFESPFNDSTRFSIDIVKDDEASTVLRELMRESVRLITEAHKNTNEN